MKMTSMVRTTKTRTTTIAAIGGFLAPSAWFELLVTCEPADVALGDMVEGEAGLEVSIGVGVEERIDETILVRGTALELLIIGWVWVSTGVVDVPAIGIGVSVSAPAGVSDRVAGVG
jgi:hypothetical protein